MSPPRDAPGRDRPWWLGGDERCPACLQRYAAEVEVRCVDCDAPVCPACAVTVRERTELVCPGCVPAEHTPRARRSSRFGEER